MAQDDHDFEAVNKLANESADECIRQFSSTGSGPGLSSIPRSSFWDAEQRARRYSSSEPPLSVPLDRDVRRTYYNRYDNRYDNGYSGGGYSGYGPENTYRKIINAIYRTERKDPVISTRTSEPIVVADEPLIGNSFFITGTPVTFSKTQTGRPGEERAQIRATPTKRKIRVSETTKHQMLFAALGGLLKLGQVAMGNAARDRGVPWDIL